MELYFYLTLSLVYVSLWFLIFMVRADLRSKLLFTGITGGLAGVISEFWYIQDYWRPPTILGTAISVEDFLFGFGVAGVGATLYQIFSQKVTISADKHRLYALPLVSIVAVIVMLVFNELLKVNSIVVSYGILLSLFIFVSVQRRDLLIPSLFNGVLLSLLAVLIYSVLLPMVPDYAAKYWLLYGTNLEVMIMGIPLTEIFWFLTFGLAAGCFYEYLWGLKLRPKSTSQK